MQNRKIAIYSRKSKFTGKGDSIANQIDSCKRKIAVNYPDVKHEDILIFEDEGFSGKDINRPQFKAMMDAIKSGKIEAVYTYKIDRISRSVGDFAHMTELFDDMNVTYTSATEDFDTSSPMGRAMMQIITVFAQLERETIAERVRDNLLGLAQTGRWLGGVAPTGYQSSEIKGVSVDGRERKAFRLDIIKDEAKMVKLIFQKFIETNSLTKTETFLIQNNIKTKNNKNHTRFSIKSILENPVYVCADNKIYDYFENINANIHSDKSKFDGKNGLMVYNKTVQNSKSSDRTRPVEEWIVAVGRHMPIMGSDSWIKAQNMLAQNSSKSYRKPKSNSALLSGLLYCSDCGSFMRPKQYSSINENGVRNFSYLCELKEKSRCQKCNIDRVNGNELDKLICEEIKKLSSNSGTFFANLEKAQNNLHIQKDSIFEDIDNFKKQIDENKTKINNLIKALSSTAKTPAYDYINEEINALHKENQATQSRIDQLNSICQETLLPEEEIQALKQKLHSFAETFEMMSIEEKRSALRVFVKKVVWDGENVHLFLMGSDEALADFVKPQSDGCIINTPSRIS